MESKAPFERFVPMDILESRGFFARVMMPCKQELTNPE